MSPASWSFVLPDAKRGRSLAIIYATVALNAAMIGLVFPILPRLIREVTHSPDVAPYVGWMAVLYAVMQFVFAPVLGTLSDRLGRRPVLLVSLAGAAINYVVMALAPQFWMLRLGRAVAGLTSANMSVATAYITDITPGEQRARRLGLMGTMFGAGFVIGPVLGGVLGEQWGAAALRRRRRARRRKPAAGAVRIAGISHAIVFRPDRSCRAQPAPPAAPDGLDAELAAAGQRGSAGAIAGVAALVGQPGFDRRAAWILRLLFRGAATMAWCRLARRRCRQPAGRAVRAARYCTPSRRRQRA